MATKNQRIWGWYFFDWASQPYNTLILTFIFGPYFAKVATEQLMAAGMDAEAAKAQAQAYWGWGLAITGVLIAICAPIFGSIADNSGRKMPWIWFFSVLYVIGSAALWWTAPDSFSVTRTLFFFGVGMIGMEFATIFTNAYLPELEEDPAKRGRISGSGWGFGYVGGVVALAIMIGLFQATDKGTTLAGLKPLFGLDHGTEADTRIVGPLTAVWFAVFMIPFFLWVRDKQKEVSKSYKIGEGLSGLWQTIKGLRRHPSLLSFLVSSMFYRDALNGMYTFGGIYAFGVLGWSVIDIGIFGIIGAVTGAIFCWISGRVDARVGPMPVIVCCCLALIATAIVIVTMTPNSLMGFAVEKSTTDIAFYIAGAVIGAAGGALGASSRNMMTRQGNPDRMTEGFGLYALSGKATSFLAPALIALVSEITGSQRLGITPIVGLFIIGLILLAWVKPKGDFAR